MTTQNTCCSLVSYFKFTADPKTFKKLCEAFVKKTTSETKCLYYGWFISDEDQGYCQEGYEDADGLLMHLEHVNDLIQELLKLGDITRLEVHGPEAELAKLRSPLADFKPHFFTLECGFRK
jgi:quinol monooxygenase YgiN